MELAVVLRLLRRHWLAIVAATLLGGLLGYAWTLTQTPVYQAGASGFVSTGSGSNLALAAQGDAYAISRASSYVAIGKTRPVAESARASLGVETAADALSARVTVANPAGTALIQITASGPRPEAAKDLADAWLAGMVEQVSVIENAGAETDTAVTRLLAFESAELPGAPVSPNVRLALAVGALVGLVVGVVYAFVRSLLDRRIRSARQIEETFDLAVIGTIPVDRRFTDADRLAIGGGSTDYRAQDRDNGVAEALRELRTNLEFMDIDNSPRVIVVTSPLPGDGKSTVTANLALTIAASGQRVVVVDGDLRRPTIAKTFGLVGGVGLTDVLVGRAEIEDVLQPWGDDGNLFVLAAGSAAPNPSELVGSRIMHILLEELAREYIVLVDAPPLIPVTDAAILAARADGALLVTSVGRSTIEAVEKALANLEKVNGHVLGVILNKVTRRDAEGQYYGYYYSAEYAAQAPAEAAAVIPVERRGRLRHAEERVVAESLPARPRRGSAPAATRDDLHDGLVGSLADEFGLAPAEVENAVERLLADLSERRTSAG